MSDQDDLKQLFTEATANIRPQGTYDDIRTRTEKVDPMARRWFLPTIAAAAMMALVIGGATYLLRDDGITTAGPADTPTADTSEIPGFPEREFEVTVFYVGESASKPRLFSEVHQIRTRVDPFEAAVSEAMTADPFDPDYTNYWPELAPVQDVGFDGETIHVRLTDGAKFDRPAGMSAEIAELQVDAIVRTAQAATGKLGWPVEFTRRTVALDNILGVPGSVEGSTLNVPRPNYDNLDDLDALAPVQITNLVHNQKVPPGDLVVKGVAAVFEANVLWELLVDGDAVVKSGFATAAECCTLAPYEFVLEDLEPGTYTLVVHDEDMSGEGRPVNSDTKEIVVE